jgi:hypothetical protein
MLARLCLRYGIVPPKTSYRTPSLGIMCSKYEPSVHLSNFAHLYSRGEKRHFSSSSQSGLRSEVEIKIFHSNKHSLKYSRKIYEFFFAETFTVHKMQKKELSAKRKSEMKKIYSFLKCFLQGRKIGPFFQKIGPVKTF